MKIVAYLLGMIYSPAVNFIEKDSLKSFEIELENTMFVAYGIDSVYKHKQKLLYPYQKSVNERQRTS
jgi:hypothetical protein